MPVWVYDAFCGAQMSDAWLDVITESANKLLYISCVHIKGESRTRERYIIVLPFVSDKWVAQFHKHAKESRAGNCYKGLVRPREENRQGRIEYHMVRRKYSLSSNS